MIQKGKNAFIHEFLISFCSCSRAGSRDEILLDQQRYVVIVFLASCTLLFEAGVPDFDTHPPL
jgi:hypothetical protein